MAPAQPAAGLCYVPVPDEAGRTTFLFMDPLGGRDRIVYTIASKGWTEFERPLPAIFHACVAANGGLVVDVGANSGFYSLLATCASATARVLAFEPERTALEVLRRNIAANRGGERIEAVEIAVSSHTNSGTLYVPMSVHDQLETSSSLEATFKPPHREVRKVRTTTLDDFLASHPSSTTSGAPRVSVIKMDVEGHEAAVVAGARRTIARWRPILLIELLPRGDAAALTQLLAEENYVDVPLRSDGKLQPEIQMRHDRDHWNHAMVPTEALEGFVRAIPAVPIKTDVTPSNLMTMLFDREYYLNKNPDVAASGIDPLSHFMERGWREGRNPSAAFDTKLYLKTYPDVSEANFNPLAHYVQFGCTEGRAVFAVGTPAG